MEFNAEGDPDKAKFVAIVDEYFSLLDTDGSGTITKDEVEEGLIDQMDADGDGKISKEEFLEYLVEDVEDDDGDYAEAAKGWRKLVRQLKEEAKTKAKKDRGKKRRGRERGGGGGRGRGGEEGGGGANRDQSGFIPFDACLLSNGEPHSSRAHPFPHSTHPCYAYTCTPRPTNHKR